VKTAAWKQSGSWPTCCGRRNWPRAKNDRRSRFRPPKNGWNRAPPPPSVIRELGPVIHRRLKMNSQKKMIQIRKMNENKKVVVIIYLLFALMLGYWIFKITPIYMSALYMNIRYIWIKLDKFENSGRAALYGTLLRARVSSIGLTLIQH
jgi:hypothetical protein